MFLLLLLYDVRGFPYGDRTVDVWSWLLPNVVPTLMLIISVLVMEARGKKRDSMVASRFLFGLALALSVVYLMTLLVLLVFPANFTDQNPLDKLKASGVYLGPFQGLVTAALGAFFVQRT